MSEYTIEQAKPYHPREGSWFVSKPNPDTSAEYDDYYYLHHDGRWKLQAVEDGNPTGYFDTAASAAECLARTLAAEANEQAGELPEQPRSKTDQDEQADGLSREPN